MLPDMVVLQYNGSLCVNKLLVSLWPKPQSPVLGTLASVGGAAYPPKYGVVCGTDVRAWDVGDMNICVLLLCLM